MKIALCIIAKGNEKDFKNVDRALSSISPFVDGIFVTLTGVKSELKAMENMLKKYNAHISYYRTTWKAEKKDVEWLKNFFGWQPNMKEGDELFLFDEARNFNFSQVPKDYEWILWIDSDDVFLGGDKLKSVAQRALQDGIEALYFEYLYQVEFDEKNNIKYVIIKHLRERLVRNIGVYKWIAPIHETLIEQRPTKKVDNYECQVLHLATEEDRLESLSRNLKNLELAILKTDGKDPRHNYYLAKALFDINTPESNEKALKLIFEYEEGEHKSGWPEERSQGWDYVAQIYKRKGELNNGIKACMNALIEQPESKMAWLTLASLYMLKKDWDRALFWVRMASSVPSKKTTLIQNPKDEQAKTLEVIYNSSLNKGMIDEAWAAAQKLVELFPNDPMMLNTLNFINSLKNERDLTNMYLNISNHLKKIGEWPKIKPLLASAPQIMQNNPFIIELYKQNNPPTYWDKNSIVIYCGQGFTNWSPKRLIDPQNSFVGGSEEAVILMSKELAKKGWDVTVYADPGNDEGVYDGVKWLSFFKFNRLDHFNILIAWRDIRFFDADFDAKKRYLWLHDIASPLEYTKERVAKINKVFFLSNWHRDNVPDLPEEKVMLTSNGIEI